MLSFALCLGLSNIGLLPAASPAYEFCWKRLLPLAVSLGLLSASAGAPRGSNDGELRPMLLAFGVGAVGTIVGAFVAFGACTRLGLYSTAQAAVAAALLAATYVGGSANFFGVASAVASPARDGSLVASLLAADLGLMAIYLLALTAAARSPPLRRAFPEATPGKYAAAVAAAIPPIECPTTTLRGRGESPPARPPVARPARSSSDWCARAATSSIVRAISALALGTYHLKFVGRDVSPNPGESCAMTVASSLSASRVSAPRSHDHAFAPNPWQHATTARGGPGVGGRRSL